LSVKEGIGVAPKAFGLSQNYPNPFNPSTTIEYSLVSPELVSVRVYDVLGREVATLVNGVKEAGYYSATFDASKLSSGIYFAKLQSGDKMQMKKMLMIK
jgi:Secretion system C-terminal sorting domain